MKQIRDLKDLRVGGIYNVVYTGDNEAYARINGRSTIRITELSPKMKSVTLFDQFGDPTKDDIRSNEATYGTKPFGDSDIFEPDDESQWLKKSLKFGSLQEALDQGLITMETIKSMAAWHNSNQSPFVAHWGPAPKREVIARSCCFRVEDKVPTHPLLQSVFIVWKNWEEEQADFGRIGIAPRR